MSPFSSTRPPTLGVCVGKAAEPHKGPFIQVGQGEEISFRSKNRGSKKEMETTGLHIWSYYKVSSRLPRERRHSCPRSKGHLASMLPTSPTPTHTSITDKPHVPRAEMCGTRRVEGKSVQDAHMRPCECTDAGVLPSSQRVRAPLLGSQTSQLANECV